MATQPKKYTPNHQGTGEMLVGPEVRSVVTQAGEYAVALYQERVTKDTGENARSVRMHTEIGGHRNDRWTSVVTAFAPHAPAREFGNERTPNPEHVLQGIAHDLESGIDA